tara:strand:- start:12667 stop:12945 length:279 start_codon:yes stop_codon:yes gene_type:complete
MTKKSSKQDMRDPLHLLQSIEQASINTNVYDAILEKIDAKKPLISIQWLRSAAAIFICLVGIEGYLLSSETNQETNDFSDLIVMTNNTLYNE